MKIKINKTEEVIDIIDQYWYQMGETISERAREYLKEQIEMNSKEIEIEE